MSVSESLPSEIERRVAAPRSKLFARLWRSAKIAGAALLLTAASVGGYWGILQYQGNFHTVAAGVLYRSAQLSRAEFRTAAQERGIRAVLNLRGPHTGQSWYDQEIAAANELHLAHYDYGLSSKRVVTQQQIADILDIIKKAPKPILIHCQSGSDRTGLISAIYRFAVDGAAPAEADRELSLAYGHFPYLMSRSGAMDQSFWAYVRDRGTAPAK